MAGNPFLGVAPVREDGEKGEDNPFIGIDAAPNLAPAAVRARQHNPDGFAKAQRLGQQVGMPADVLARNPEDAARVEMDARLDRVRAENPDLAAWLADGDNLTLAQDDLDSLGAVESAWTAERTAWLWPDLSRSFVGGAVGEGVGSATSGTGTLAEGQGRRLQRQDFGDYGDEEDIGGAFFGALLEAGGDAVRYGGDQIQAFGNWLKPPKERQFFATDVAAGLGQVGTQAMAGPAAVPAMFASGADIANKRAEKAGATQEEADAAAVQGAVVTGASERLLGLFGKFGLDKVPGVRRLLDRLGPGGNRVATAVTGGLEEGTQEVVEGIGHDVVAKQYDPNAVIGSGIVDDFSVAGTVGLLFRAAVHAPSVRRIDNSQRSATFLETLHQAVSTGKLAQRSPEALSSLVAALKAQGGPQDAFINAEDFVALYQSENDAYAAAASLTGDPEHLQVALASNGDLAIPMEKFVPLLATDIGPAAILKAKLDPEHLAVDEAKAADREAEIQTIMQALQAEQGSQEPVESDAAYQDVLGELIGTGRYSKADAEQMAKLLPRFYAGIARLTGRSAEDVRAQYPVTVLSDTIGDRLRRTDPAAETLAITPVLDAIRANTIPTASDAYGPSLTEMLAARGGVNDAAMTGEIRRLAESDNARYADLLASIGGARPETTKAAKAFLPLVKQGAALSLDNAVEAAVEAGYLPEGSDINDLLDALDRELVTNDPIYVEANRNQDIANLRETALAWQSELPGLLGPDETLGDLLALSNTDILKRAREAVREAYEQTVYHGSPFRGIEKTGFSLSKIGTGEGAQAYGWGLYFAGKREVAEHYRKRLSDGASDAGAVFVNGERIKTMSAEGHAARLLYYNDAREIRALAKSMLKEAKAGEPYTVETAAKHGLSAIEYYERLAAFVASHNRKQIRVEKGQVYSVEIPEDSELLDNDAGMASQSPRVQNAARAFLRALGYMRDGENGPRQLASSFREAAQELGGMVRRKDGAVFYEMLTKHFKSPQAASLWLNEHGIPGLKFKAGLIAGRKNVGDNYVIWDESAISEPATFYQSATDQTETPEFKRWFGDSKVVDGQGKPLIVWHGGGKFDAFQETPESLAHYASEDLDVAQGYASQDSPKNSEIKPLYLRIKNPLDLRDPDLFEEWTGVSSSGRMAAKSWPMRSGGDVVKRAIAAGYDGIIFYDTDVRNRGSHVAYAFFDPRQAKAAPDLETQSGTWWSYPIRQDSNRGTFDPNDPSILHQPADGGHPGRERGSIQFPKAGIGRGAAIVRLAEGADQTTFVHELGHLFLEVMANEAAMPDASPALSKEMQTVLDWFGVADVATWRAMNLEEKRAYHEQFARGFEKYLAEGKAPSRSLRSAFRKFKTWMLAVYRDLSRLNVDLTDDVRSVFDRLLATEAEIAEAQQQAEFVPALPVEEARKLGMSEAAIARYANTLERAKESLAAKLLAVKFRETKAWYKAQVRAMREVVRAEAEDSPVYRTIAGLRTGKNLPAPVKLSKDALVEKVGEGSLARFRGMYAVEGGASLDVVADAFGWPSSDVMLSAILNAKPLREFVNAEADARVREQHGDPLADGTAQSLAQQALHNSRMAGALQAEIDLLAKLANAPGMDPVAVREAAKRYIAGLTARQLRPHQFLVAERKAAAEAAKQAAAGKYGEALVAKRQQALNAALYAEARAAEAMLERFRKRVAKLSKGPAQKRLAAAKGGYLDRVNEILHAYEFRPLSAKEARRRASLRAWVDNLQDAGEITSVSDELIARVESERVTNWRDVPIAELQSVRETLRNLEHLATLKNRLTAGARKAHKEAAIDEMIARAESVLGSGGPPDVVDKGDLSRWERARETLRALGDAITRPETIIEALDGGESGPFHDFLWAAQVTAENTKLALMKRIGGALRDLHKALPADFWPRTDEFVTFKGVRMKRYTLISAAFNLGNAGNRQRLRDGGISTASGRRLELTDADLPALASMLTAAELRYVQGVWDAVDSLRPDIEALTRRMGAVPVTFVDAAPLSVQSADGEMLNLRGGYWPLAYHSERSTMGERQESDDALKILMQAGASRAATSKGYTKSRAEELSAPLLLNFGQVLSRSLDQVMTDLAYREAVRDLTMLLHDPRLKSFLIARAGKGAYDSLRGGVAYSVSAGADVTGLVAGTWRNAMDWVIANGTVSALAIRPDIALGNFASAMVQGLDRVGKRAVLDGLRRLYFDRGELTREIIGLSPFMENRLTEIDQGYQKALVTSQGKKGFRAAYFRVMMTLHRVADHEVTRALWWGRYSQELAAGQSQAEAVRLADKSIRQTQTASGKKDFSTFERDPAFRQSKQFMGPMFVIFGRLRAAAAGTGNTREAGARATSLVLQWGLAPAIFALAAGRAPDDDDDDGDWSVGDWGRWIAREVGMFPLQTIPIAREMAAIGEGLLSDKPISPRASPTAQAAGNMAKASRALADNLKDEEGDGIEYDEMTRDLITLAGPLTGAPSSQWRKTDKAVDAVLDNPDQGALELTELLLYGKPVYVEPER